MNPDKEQLNSFLKEGENWFKDHHLYEIYPDIKADIKKISEAINKFSESVSSQAKSSEKLSESIKCATWVAVGIASFALAWDVIKTLCIGQ